MCEIGGCHSNRKAGSNDSLVESSVLALDLGHGKAGFEVGHEILPRDTACSGNRIAKRGEFVVEHQRCGVDDLGHGADP